MFNQCLGINQCEILIDRRTCLNKPEQALAYILKSTRNGKYRLQFNTTETGVKYYRTVDASNKRNNIDKPLNYQPLHERKLNSLLCREFDLSLFQICFLEFKCWIHEKVLLLFCFPEKRFC